jgi:beta-sarcoglycan
MSDEEPEIIISQDKVEFRKVEGFEMFEPRTTPKTSAFSTTFPNFGLPKGVLNLHIKKATANRITSKLEGSLLIRSEKAIRVKGKEGMRIRGKEVVMRADQDLLLRSINGSIILDGFDGVIMDVDAMAVTGRLEDHNATKVAEYKLCICMPAGQLFRIPVLESTDTINCDSVDLTGDDNPCI